MMNKSIVNIFIALSLLQIVTALVAKDMATCDKNARGLCKCDASDILGASCSVCKSDSACGKSMQCRNTGLALGNELNGWCAVADKNAREYVDGTPHIELNYNAVEKTATMDVYRENDNSKFQSLFTCEMSTCSQVKDNKNDRVFTKCLNVDTCRATCKQGKSQTHYCNKIKKHFSEQENRNIFTADVNKGNRAMRFLCKHGGTNCAITESYGLMQEFQNLKRMDCTFSECITRTNENKLRHL